MSRSSVLVDIIDRALAEPLQLAATDLDRQLSYAELIDEVRRVGAGLVSHGVTEGDLVALLMPNSVDFIVGALATLWVGATFAPLAVTDPMPRLLKIVRDAMPKLIVTAPSTDAGPTQSIDDLPMVPLDQLRGVRRAAEYLHDASRVDYVIYTSGTTGTPKGVQIGDVAFYASVDATVEALGFNQATRTLCVSPFHFDGSYANLFPTLVSGGTVIMRPREHLLYPRMFFNTIDAERITYAGFTPSYLRLLLASPQLPRLRNSTLEIIALGGEAIAVEDLRTLWTQLPSIRVFNRYGPTEATIAVTNVELTPSMVKQGDVTIGRPHPGVEFVLFDDGEVVTSPNRIGELFIGGVQLMNGYLADPELTAMVMRRDVVADRTLYRTGDLVYRNDEGEFFYVNRADRVVKRQGVRISLDELSTSMSQLNHVTMASCVTFDFDGDLGIAAFVVLDDDATVLELRRQASKVLPLNMLPDRIERVVSMPLNRLNLVDEAELLAAVGLRPFRPNSKLP